MTAVLEMGLIGWAVSLVVGFVVGGVFFLTMKLQVEYVVKQHGPLWLVPVAMYARILLVAIVLVLVAVGLKEQREKIPAAMLAATAGAVIARILVGRMVRSEEPAEAAPNDGHEPPSPEAMAVKRGTKTQGEG